MNKGLGKSILALALAEAIEKTCINCGELKELCNCKKFKNIKNETEKNISC